MKVELDIPIDELWIDSPGDEINPAMILTDMILQNGRRKNSL